MLRRTTVTSNIWAKYRFSHAAVPKGEGPPPLAAPVQMNRTKQVPNLDPINDPFPRTIRGNMSQPDVPDHNYVNQWYFLYNTTATGELFPWSSTAPENSFRLRSHNEFNRIGRDGVQSLRETDRLRLPDGSFRNAQRGSKALPNREEFLTKMNSSNNTKGQLTGAPSPCTVMDRARKERYQGIKHLSPLQEQRDVGRHEPIPAIAANIPVDKAAFPYNWNTEDWYEWEISKVRMQRFAYENAPAGAGANPFSSEVTYKVILTATWEHHANPFADDIAAFLREVGRQVIEEKLISVRQSLLSVRQGKIDEDLRAAYKLNENDHYSDDEIRMQQQRELEQLESECVYTLSLINASSSSDQTNHKDANTAWPLIEDMEPWVRMVEFWGERADTTYATAEMSTKKFEFRKFFRVVKIKMPFQSTEFEKRMYDIRHWGHRGMDLEFHTIHKKNIIHDSSLFPVEHDPVQKHSHEHHRMFSFALDWHQAPANFMSTTEVVNPNGESVESISERLGCSVASLKKANPKVFASNNSNSSSSSTSTTTIKQGTILTIPRDATKRLASTSVTAKKVLLSELQKSVPTLNWKTVSQALNCTIEELQAANGEALATYQTEDDKFAESIQELNIPSSILSPALIDGFSSLEPTFVADTFEDIATRLTCSVEDLKKANPDLEDPSKVTHVNVPATAKTPRRRSDPLLRSAESSDELFTKLKGEMLPYEVNKEGGIPSSIPNEPTYAKEFPGEFADSTENYPINPGARAATEDWLSYTAAYLDPDLSVKTEAQPRYNVNRVWPVQSIPGSMQQEPFQEDQTWMLHRIPAQTHEVADPDSDIKGLPKQNDEQLAQSMEWRAP